MRKRGASFCVSRRIPPPPMRGRGGRVLRMAKRRFAEATSLFPPHLAAALRARGHLAATVWRRRAARGSDPHLRSKLAGRRGTRQNARDALARRLLGLARPEGGCLGTRAPVAVLSKRSDGRLSRIRSGEFGAPRFTGLSSTDRRSASSGAASSPWVEPDVAKRGKPD